jgi:tripartite ATP-independent transporter DctM subunit
MLVLMGDLMSISVGELFMGAFIPGLLLSFLYLVYIGVVSTIHPAVAPLPPREGSDLPAGVLARRVLRSFVPPTAMILLVLGSIFMGWATPTEASGVGAAGAILLALANRRLTGKALADVARRTALTVSMVFIIFVGATGFSYVFRSLGGEDQVDRILLSLPFGAWGILTILMGVIFFLGFFFDWVEITLIVLPVFGPIVQKLDFGAHLPDAQHVLLWFAILVAVNLQTSFLTPPFGFALFYLKGVAPPDVTVGHIYRGIVPFVVLQLIGLACVIAFPRLAIWLPDAVFK